MNIQIAAERYYRHFRLLKGSLGTGNSIEIDDSKVSNTRLSKSHYFCEIDKILQIVAPEVLFCIDFSCPLDNLLSAHKK